MREIPVRVGWARDGSLDKAVDELELECESIIRGITVELYNRILRTTPQFYGRMVASYTYSLHYPVFADNSLLVESTAFNQDVQETKDWDYIYANLVRSKGDQRAISIARGLTNAVDERFKLGDTVWIANGVDHGEGPYANDVEAPNIHLRAVNRPGRAAGRALDYIQSRFGNSVSSNAAEQLKTLKLSQEQ